MAGEQVQLERAFMEAYAPCIDYTMVDWARCHSVWNAVNYLVSAHIPGDFVECGVWKGGVCMLMARALDACAKEQGQDASDARERHLWLYDTFAGMAQPTDLDVSFGGEPAHDKWAAQQQAQHNDWCFAPLEEVQKNLESTGYPQSCMHFVKGRVEETIAPDTGPEQIALLRLDTDWYASTYHELTHLYPRLAVGGVVIFDDAYHWHGQRKALDQYCQEQGITLMLNRINTSIIAIKTAPHGLSRAEREALVATA